MFFTPPPLLSLRVIRNLLSKCAENQAIRFWELVGSFFCALVVIGSPQAFAKSSQSVENLLDAEFKVEALENWLLVEQEIDESELASLYLETENAEEYLGMLTDLVTEYMESAELSDVEVAAIPALVGWALAGYAAGWMTVRGGPGGRPDVCDLRLPNR